MSGAKRDRARPSSPKTSSRTSAPARRRGAELRRDDAPSPMAVLHQFRELFRASQRHFQRIEARCGVSGAQLWALSEVERRPGLTISELAKALSIHLSTSSNLLDKLENLALVRRERGTEDQRTVFVHLTAKGRKLLAAAPRPVDGVIPHALGRMPRTAIRRLHGDLNVLLELASLRRTRDAMKPLSEP